MLKNDIASSAASCVILVFRMAAIWVLYCFFLNILPDCNILMYPDDVKLFFTFNDDHSQSVLQLDIDLFVNWCKLI